MSAMTMTTTTTMTTIKMADSDCNDDVAWSIEYMLFH